MSPTKPVDTEPGGTECADTTRTDFSRIDQSEAPRLATEVVAGGQGPVLLMIHGMLSSRAQWADNVGDLKAFCRPVLIELWGHGQSPSPEQDEHYTVDALLQAIDEIRVEQGAEQVLLCTQSFGAGLGLHYCLKFPERVLGHVFTNSISAIADPAGLVGNSDLTKRVQMVKDLGHDALSRMPFHPRRARRLDPDLRDRLIAIADRTDPHAFIKLTENTRPHISVADRLHEIACPTLLVNGLWEKRFQTLRDRVVERMTNIEVVDLEAGHAVNLEQAQAFNAAVARFIKTLSRERVQ